MDLLKMMPNRVFLGNETSIFIYYILLCFAMERSLLLCNPSLHRPNMVLGMLWGDSRSIWHSVGSTDNAVGWMLHCSKSAPLPCMFKHLEKMRSFLELFAATQLFKCFIGPCKMWLVNGATCMYISWCFHVQNVQKYMCMEFCLLLIYLH